MYQRKEIKYQALLSALKGFYNSSDSKVSLDLKQSFLNELGQCWLYCPDEVIRKGNSFLNTVGTSETQPDAVKERAIGEFILAIRNDLYAPFKIFRKTALKPEDFKILKAN